MRSEAKSLMEIHGLNFHTALAYGSKRIMQLVFNSPALTHGEKIREVRRITQLVFRFDQGTFSDEDAIEAFILLGVVPENHPAHIATPLLQK